MQEYAVVFDIAKRRDFTAGFVVRQTPEIVPGNPALGSPDRIINTLDILHIDKFNGLTYPEMVEKIALRVGHADLQDNCDLLVDGTGVGEAAVDLLRDRGLQPIPVIFTAGNQVQTIFWDFGGVFGQKQGLSTTRSIKEIHVPKADLVDAGKLLAQQDRVRCDEDIKWAMDFRDQLGGFRGKVNEKTGRVRFEAEAEDIHDDLIVCYLMSAWWMLQDHENEIKERPVPRGREDRDWSPMEYL